MPSTSKAQHNFMAAIANSPSFAKKAGVPMSVGKDFTAADKALKLPARAGSRPDLQKVNNPKTNQGRSELFKEGGDTMASKMNSGFMAMIAKKKEGMHKMPDGKMMKDSAMTKMAEGGVSESGGRGVTTVPGDKKLGSPSRYVTKILPSGSKPLTGQRPEKEGAGFKRGGMPTALAKHAAKPASKAHAGLKAGGSVDGIASKGKTKGKQIKMMGGGKC